MKDIGGCDGAPPEGRILFLKFADAAQSATKRMYAFLRAGDVKFSLNLKVRKDKIRCLKTDALKIIKSDDL